jgi:hypothetical protein
MMLEPMDLTLKAEEVMLNWDILYADFGRERCWSTGTMLSRGRPVTCPSEGGRISFNNDICPVVGVGGSLIVSSGGVITGDDEIYISLDMLYS